jgi:3-hydroxy acid dehydrogenase / malonic semialdehyde reductase
MSLVFISGATSGIGLETAKLFAQKGHAIIINGRREDRLAALKKELSSLVEVHTACFDVADRAAVDAWFAANSELAGKIEILVNNAGLARGVDPIQKAKMDDWEEMIDTNIKGLLYISHKVAPSMVEKKKGHIINLGSVAGRWTYPGGTVYSATKFAVRALTEGFRLDMVGTGVRVTNIEPGMVETEFSEVRFRDKNKAEQVYKGMTPLSAKDVAETIVWTADRPAHVNIQELIIYPTDQVAIREVHRQL